VTVCQVFIILFTHGSQDIKKPEADRFSGPNAAFKERGTNRAAVAKVVRGENPQYQRRTLPERER